MKKLLKEYFKLWNKWDIQMNSILVNNYGNGCLQFICHNEKQLDKVNELMTKQMNLPVGYEEWDEGKDKKYIITYQIAGMVDVYQS